MKILHVRTGLKTHTRRPRPRNTRQQRSHVVEQEFPLFTVYVSSHIVGVRACTAGIDGPQTFRVRVRKTIQQERIHNRKNRGVDTDRKRESEDDGDGETGVARQHAETEAKILAEMIPPKPVTGFVETLFGLHEIAEGAASGGSGVRFA